MSSKSRDPDNNKEMERVHLWLYAEDLRDVRQFYGDSLGLSKAIRLMVSKSMNQIRLRAAAKANPVAIHSGQEIEEVLGHPEGTPVP